MQSLILPPQLVPHQKVRVIAPSGALREWERFEQGVQIWRDRGYQVQIPDDMNQPWGYLAGKDEHRCQQLLAAWNDPECAAILCARGGYGSTRLLERLNWQDLKPQPKWLIGFSDITALLWGLAANLGIGGLHAPVLTTLAAEPDWSVQQLFDWLEGKSPSITLKGNGWGGDKTSGTLLAGNLTVATHLLNTQLCPDLNNVILAFEDVGEAPYRIDRMITHWRMTGALAKIKGIALGRFSGIDESALANSLTIAEVWRDRLTDLNIPVVSDLPFGHDGTNICLAIGCLTELDGNAGYLTYQYS